MKRGPGPPGGLEGDRGSSCTGDRALQGPALPGIGLKALPGAERRLREARLKRGSRPRGRAGSAAAPPGLTSPRARLPAEQEPEERAGGGAAAGAAAVWHRPPLVRLPPRARRQERPAAGGRRAAGDGALHGPSPAGERGDGSCPGGVRPYPGVVSDPAGVGGVGSCREQRVGLDPSPGRCQILPWGGQLDPGGEGRQREVGSCPGRGWILPRGGHQTLPRVWVGSCPGGCQGRQHEGLHRRCGRTTR